MARFKPGQSGNPAGRPRGSPNKATQLRELIRADMPEIIAALVTKAKDGDAQSASVLLSRVLPPLRPISEGQTIQAAGETLADRAEAVAAAALTGDLSPSTAGELMSVLAAQSRVIEISELAARLERIEAALKAQENRK
jgi:hypothetical protein